jgi:glutamate dehydrogenase/leucine dehydrogenase
MHKILKKAFTEVYELSVREKVGFRLAALMIGVDRVAESIRLRGLYP